MRIVVVLLGLGLVLAPAPATKIDYRLSFAIDGTDLRLDFPYSASLRSFAVSPSGERLAAEFVVGKGEGLRGAWVAVWDTDTQKIVNQRRLTGPTKETLTDPRESTAIRYSAGGHHLIVLAGESAFILDPESLEIRLTIYPAEYPEQEGPMYLRAVAVNEKEKVCAVVENWRETYSDVSYIRILGLETGAEIARWKIRGSAHGIELAPEGKRVLLALRRVALVRDTKTGARMSGVHPGYHIADAVFAKGGKEIITVANGFDDYPTFPDNTIKVWDSGTGRLKWEIRYGKIGIRGRLALAREAGLVAVFSDKPNIWDIKLDRTNPRAKHHLLIWELASAELIYTSSKLDGAYTDDGPRYYTSASADGSVIAAGTTRIHVFRRVAD